jgi:ribosomal protein S18 acetylase RimI-like enzyme
MSASAVSASRESVPELSVRAMEPGDVPRAVEVAATAFDTDLTEPGVGEWFLARSEHLLATDPHGAFVAEREGKIVGVAQAMVRDRLWCLALLAVHPSRQSFGAGRALIERALGYGDAADAGLIVSSNDPRALRLYAREGFSLQPTFAASGSVDRSAIPAADPRVEEAASDELEALESIARETRGAAYTPELALVLAHGGRLLRFEDRGFAVAHERHGLWALVARDEEAATALSWRALELRGEGPRSAIRWITGGQDWAVDVAVRAGLRLSAYGALCVRGRPGPLRPFIPSGPFA